MGSHVIAFYRRNLTHYLRDADSIVGVVITPLIFLLGPLMVFGRLMERTGVVYEQYLPPAVIVQSMLVTAIGSAFYTAHDHTEGLLARWRTMPVSRAAFVLGRAAADVTRALASLVVVLVVGTAAGFRFSGSVSSVVLFVLLALAFAWVCALGTSTVGLRASAPDAVIAILTVPYLVLFIMSTAFVPLSSYPGWLQPIIGHQPVSVVIDTLRGLADDRLTRSGVVETAVWMLVLVAMFGSLSARAYRRDRS